MDTGGVGHGKAQGDVGTSTVAKNKDPGDAEGVKDVDETKANGVKAWEGAEIRSTGQLAG